jgi:hypothetical protein
VRFVGNEALCANGVRMGEKKNKNMEKIEAMWW